MLSLSSPKPSWVTSNSDVSKERQVPWCLHPCLQHFPRVSQSHSRVLLPSFTIPAASSSPFQATRASILQQEIYRGCLSGQKAAFNSLLPGSVLLQENKLFSLTLYCSPRHRCPSHDLSGEVQYLIFKSFCLYQCGRRTVNPHKLH